MAEYKIKPEACVVQAFQCEERITNGKRSVVIKGGFTKQIPEEYRCKFRAVNLTALRSILAVITEFGEIELYHGSWVVITHDGRLLAYKDAVFKDLYDAA